MRNLVYILCWCIVCISLLCLSRLKNDMRYPHWTHLAWKWVLNAHPTIFHMFLPSSFLTNFHHINGTMDNLGVVECYYEYNTVSWAYLMFKQNKVSLSWCFKNMYIVIQGAYWGKRENLVHTPYSFLVYFPIFLVEYGLL